MRTQGLVTKLLVAASLVAIGAASAQASDSKQVRSVRTETPKERVVLVQVTGSWIPQRVVLAGNLVNSASPVVFYGRNDLLRSGSVDVAGTLASVDPNIFIRRQ